MNFSLKDKKNTMTIRRKVKRVPDGDIIELYRRLNGSKFVRIADKNAPELHQFGGIQARDKLKQQIQNKVVTLQPVGRSYNRIVAKIRSNRKLIR